MHQPTPFVAYTISQTERGRFIVAGWYNRAVAFWTCDPETGHLWNRRDFGQVIAEVSEIAGARAILPSTYRSMGTSLPVNTELWVAP